MSKNMNGCQTASRRQDAEGLKYIFLWRVFLENRRRRFINNLILIWIKFSTGHRYVIWKAITF